MPNGILLCITDKTGAELKEHLLKSRKTIHYYLDESGDVTALIPLSSVATQNQEEHRGKIRIEIRLKIRILKGFLPAVFYAKTPPPTPQKAGRKRLFSPLVQISRRYIRLPYAYAYDERDKRRRSRR